MAHSSIAATTATSSTSARWPWHIERWGNVVTLNIEDDNAPDPDAAKIMKHFDGLSRPMRALAYEYGYKIVTAMIDDGYKNAKELKPLLETWRERRQEEWLNTNYVTPRTAQRIADSVQNRMSKTNEEAIWNAAKH